MQKIKGFTLVEIMIVVAIIALVAAIAIPGLLRAKVAANESFAQASLKTISTSAEVFATTNNSFPTDESSLTGGAMPYLNRQYDGQTIQGYVFTCTFASGGYTC